MRWVGCCGGEVGVVGRCGELGMVWCRNEDRMTGLGVVIGWGLGAGDWVDIGGCGGSRERYW